MKKLVRLTSALLAVSFLSVLFSIPAAAADSSLNGSAELYKGGWVSATAGSYYRVDPTGYKVSYSSLTEQVIENVLPQTYSTIGLGKLAIDNGSYYSSPVGVYFSYFIECSAIASLINPAGAPTIQYKNHLGQDGTGEGSNVKVSSFTPTGITPGASSGYTYGQSISAHFQGSAEYPITSLQINGNQGSDLLRKKTGASGSLVYHVTSFRVIGVETSADLEALEGIADAIAAQNGILQAMYGDIIAICNSIYQKTGDMVTAQEQTNAYFAQLIPILESIKNINASIYSLLSTQFAALISAVEKESGNIQAAISAQTTALIAYLDSLFQVTEIPPSVSGDVSQGEQIRNDMAGLDKPEFTTPDPSDFFTDDEAKPFTDVLAQLFGSNLIVTLMLVAFSMAFVGYVLYGKR